MKNFEKILKDEVMFLINGRLNTLKLKSTDDAKLFLDRICKHLNLTWDLVSFLRLLWSCTLIFWLSTYFMLPHHILLLLLNIFNPQLSAGFPELSFQTLVLLKAVFFPLCLFIGFLVKFSDDTHLLSALWSTLWSCLCFKIFNQTMRW